MAETSSSSASSATSSTVGGNKMAGLMSGLDTASLVEAMTAATLKRLEGQKAKSQKLTWKQDGYRDIIDKLRSFQEKFTSLTSSTSLRLRSNLNKSKAVSSDSRVTATATGSAAATTYSIAGATSAKTTRIKSAMQVSTGNVDLDLSKLKAGQGYTLKLTLDGNQKDVYFAAGGDEAATADLLENAINTAFGEAYSKDVTQKFIVDDSGKLIFQDGGDGVSHNFTVGHNSDLGLANDTSNRLSSSMKLSDISFSAGALKNNQLDSDGNELNYYSFEINGVSFGFTKDNTISDIITAVNNSDANAKLSFDQMSGKMTLEASSSGAGGALNVKQTSGNLLSRLFGENDLADGTATVSKKMTYDSYGAVTAAVDPKIIEDIGKDGISDDTEYVFNLKIDGKDYSLKANKETFPPKTGEKKSYTWAELETQFVKQLKDQYNTHAASDPGLTKTADDYFAGFTVKGNSATNEITFTDNNKPIELIKGDGFTPDAKNTNVKNNVYSDSTVIVKGGVLGTDGKYEKQKMIFKADGLDIPIEGSAADGSITLRDLTNSGLFSYNSNGYLIANADINYAGTTDPNSKKFLDDFFGGKGTTGTGSIADEKANMEYQRGEDATLTLRTSDGVSTVKYQNATDSFTIDGTTINISGLSSFSSAAKEDDITVGVSKDYTAVKDLVKDFVDGYNSLLDDVRSYYDTTRPKSSGSYYEPLTEAQKKEMTADEIKDWETQAKVGLLYNDDNLQRVLDDLHSAMNTVVGGFSASAAGIELTDSFLDNNKFKINEDKLDNALAKYGDKLVDFFTNAENGLATKLNKAIDGMASTSSSKYGYLVREAGVAGDPSDKKSEIYNQLQNFQDMIDQISERYKKQQESFWARFTTLETYLAKMNMQAGIFTQQQ
jgi:flagellar capping protein FliD